MFDRAREEMVRRQLEGRGITDRHVLTAMRAVPRERFVAADYTERAYDDGPLPIGEGQTISQPYIVALMLQAAEIRPGGHVLEVGAGSGYAAAVAARIADRVVAIERHASLVEAAQRRLDGLGYANVRILAGDGTRGCAEEAPFDAIIVSAGGPEVPDALARQLRIGGRLVIPVGPNGSQALLRIRRVADRRYERDDLGEVVFVPLIGEQGWAEQASQSPFSEAESGEGGAAST
jgi:protein-L-isoaspartate(D-aspartate) O-methyltransferase